MAAITCNISKGREVEFYERVLNGDPTDAAFEIVVLSTINTGGVEGLRDYETLDEILAGGYVEVTNPGYARVTLFDIDLVAWAPDHVNNQVLLTLPLQTIGPVTGTDIWDIGVVCYNATALDTAVADEGIIPITAAELRIDGTAIPPIGDSIIIDFSNGFCLAV